MSDDLDAFRRHLKRERGALGGAPEGTPPPARGRSHTPGPALDAPGDRGVAAQFDQLAARLTGDVLRAALATAVLAALLGAGLGTAVLHVAGGGDGAAGEVVNEAMEQLRTPAIVVAAVAAFAYMSVDVRHARTGRGRWSADANGASRVASLVAVGYVLGVVAATMDLGRGAPVTVATWALVAALLTRLGVLAIQLSGRARFASSAPAGVAVVVAAAALFGIWRDHVGQLKAVERDTSTLSAAVDTGTGCTAPDPERERRPRVWLRAELICTLGDTQVRYLWLRTPRARGEYQHARLEASGVAGTGSNCNEGDFAGSWRSNATSGGRILCFAVGTASAQIEWSDRDTDIYSVATRRGSLVDLRRWWDRSKLPNESVLEG